MHGLGRNAVNALDRTVTFCIQASPNMPSISMGLMLIVENSDTPRWYVPTYSRMI